MPSSSNTFGTFLKTFNSLEQESRRASDAVPTAEVLIGVVKDIARSGDEKSVKELIRSLDLDGSRILSALVEGRQKGLMTLEENEGESLARLTPLGKAFSA